MASSTRSKSSTNKQTLDTVENDILTLKGYIKAFESCENDSDVFQILDKVINEIDVDVWKDYLLSKYMLESVEHVFRYWKKNFNDDKSVYNNGSERFIQIFCLLENVLRNVVLRPYIPAYRTIDMNCGRYRSFVTESEKELFQLFDFAENSKGLLTYNGKDPLITIPYAITCSVFWHVLVMKRKKFGSPV